MSTSIVVCDDDLTIRESIKTFLSRHHYHVTTVPDGKQLLAVLKQQSCDLVLLDIMLPGDDGLTLCRKIRKESAIPIIMVTALDEDIDQVAALEIGADYYLTKPINLRILMAYIKTLLRRQTTQLDDASLEDITHTGDVYHFENWQIIVNQRSLIAPSGVRVILSYGEFQILLALVKNPRRILTRDMLLNSALHRSEEPFDRSVDVLVSRLRRKLKAHAADYDFIKTIRGAGYLMDCQVKKSHA